MPPLPEESTPPPTQEPLAITEAFHLSKYNAEGALIEKLHYQSGDSFMVRELPDGQTEQIPLAEETD
jgi:hypothetical protein